MSEIKPEPSHAALNTNDLRRLACLYLNLEDPKAANINWDKAAKDYGSASAESMKKCVNNILKKLKEEEVRLAAGGEPRTATDDGTPVAPAKKPQAARKRKETADGDVPTTPKASKSPKTKSPRKKKGVKSEEAVEEETDAGDVEPRADADADGENAA